MPVLKSRRSGADLRNHPSVSTWAKRLCDVPDETIREILSAKDVGAGRAKIAGALTILEAAERTMPRKRRSAP